MRTLSLLSSLAVAAIAMTTTPIRAQGVGSKVPAIELEDFSQTAAKSFDEFQGRAVLIEFFAFW